MDDRETAIINKIIRAIPAGNSKILPIIYICLNQELNSEGELRK